MTLKERFRRAIRSSTTTRSSSVASSSQVSSNSTSITPVLTHTVSPTPALSLSKTSSRLSKTLTGTFRSDKSKKTKEEEWEEADKREKKGAGRQHHELLRAFEWKGAWRGSLDGLGRRGSAVSAVSPTATRVGSVDSAVAPRAGGRGERRISGHSVGGLERVRSGDVETVIEE